MIRKICMACAERLVRSVSQSSGSEAKVSQRSFPDPWLASMIRGGTGLLVNPCLAFLTFVRNLRCRGRHERHK
jgi:hypothetical protein